MVPRVWFCWVPTVLVLVPVLSAQPAWRDPSPHQTRVAEVEPSVRLEALDWGGSGPPLVLLACYISAHTYDEIAPKLTNQFHVYGITRRGIGASDKPATGYAVQQSANDAIEVLNALSVQKAILVGHSCAGQILTMVAARFPAPRSRVGLSRRGLSRTRRPMVVTVTEQCARS
jgi:non-heme chloroperoxidase